jgi:hypothetical protein
VGPSWAPIDPESLKGLLFQLVPAGTHTVWHTSVSSLVRIGEVCVPPSGDIAFAIDAERTAGIVGHVPGLPGDEHHVQLTRAADSLCVGRMVRHYGSFRFGPLHPGRYWLIIDSRRVPVELLPHQILIIEDALKLR